MRDACEYIQVNSLEHHSRTIVCFCQSVYQSLQNQITDIETTRERILVSGKNIARMRFPQARARVGLGDTFRQSLPMLISHQLIHLIYALTIFTNANILSLAACHRRYNKEL